MPRTSNKPSTIRIIGGIWRSRKIEFIATEGLRPTSDRTRETLFNWLAPVINGAHCLDLFAGSGALGLEALSRGAAQVVFVDQSSTVLQQLKHNLLRLQAPSNSANLVPADAVTSLANLPNTQPFNIVFLDPPFRKNLLKPCCHLLEEKNLLADNALIYLEAEAEYETLQLPENWELLKSKQAGQVSYYLAQRKSAPTKIGL